MNLEGNLKLKIVISGGALRYSDLEHSVNIWLETNPVEIKEIKYTSGTNSLCAMILYYKKGTFIPKE